MASPVIAASIHERFRIGILPKPAALTLRHLAFWFSKVQNVNEALERCWWARYVVSAEPAERRRVGCSDLWVSQLGFGSAPLGGLFRTTSEDDARGAVEAAWAAGLRYFDTAPQYGHGLAERRLGQVLASKPRDQFVLSTKVGKLLKKRADGTPPDSPFVDALAYDITYDYSYDAALRSIDQSLYRLGLDRIDIVFVHDVNRKYHGVRVQERLDEALSGACKALERLRSEGIIGAFGPALQDVDISTSFVNQASVDCVMLPGSYNLIDQTARELLFPACERRGVSVLIAGPFASGILATGPVPDATFNYQRASPAVVASVTALSRLCMRFDTSLAAAALQFPLRLPIVASAVTGMRSASEVCQNIEMMRSHIPNEFWEALSREGELA